MGDVEVVQRLDQPNAAHLEQVVHIFPAVAEALDDAQHQPEVSTYKFLACVQVAAMHKGKQLPHALVADDRQRGSVHTTDFYLVYRHFAPLRI